MIRWVETPSTPPFIFQADRVYKEASSHLLTCLVFMPKLSTHRMYDPGSIVPHIRTKLFIDNQMTRIKFNYYINNVSKDYDDSQAKWNGTAEDSIIP
jgi:hypothetical protein